MTGVASDDTKHDQTSEKTETNVERLVHPAHIERRNALSQKAPHLVVVKADAVNAERMGPRLRAAREALNLTIEDVAGETRIHKDYIRAIEDMTPNIIPGMPQSKSYLRGYIANYARSLGMNETEVVIDRFLTECGLSEAAEANAQQAAMADVAARRGFPWQPVAIGAGAFMALATVAGAVLMFGPWELSANAPAKPAAPVSGPGKSADAKPEAATVPGVPLAAPDLSIYAVRGSWIEVRGADGTVYLSKQMARGDVYVPRVGAGWTVTARDGGAFEWRRNGASLGALAEAGTPVYAAPVDEALDLIPPEAPEPDFSPSSPAATAPSQPVAAPAPRVRVNEPSAAATQAPARPAPAGPVAAPVPVVTTTSPSPEAPVAAAPEPVSEVQPEASAPAEIAVPVESVVREPAPPPPPQSVAVATPPVEAAPAEVAAPAVSAAPPPPPQRRR